MIDATIVRAHQHAAGAKGDSKRGHWPIARRAEHQDSYCRRCDRSSLADDAHRRTGARGDTGQSIDRGLTLVSLIADKGVDNDGFRAELAVAEVDAVIPPLGSRTADIAFMMKTRAACGTSSSASTIKSRAPRKIPLAKSPRI